MSGKKIVLVARKSSEIRLNPAEIRGPMFAGKFRENSGEIRVCANKGQEPMNTHHEPIFTQRHRAFQGFKTFGAFRLLKCPKKFEKSF